MVWRGAARVYPYMYNKNHGEPEDPQGLAFLYRSSKPVSLMQIRSSRWQRRSHERWRGRRVL